MRLLTGILLTLLLTSCSAVFKNYGDGEFNPEFRDTFLDGKIDVGDLSVEYGPYVKDAALILTAAKAPTALNVVQFLEDIKNDVQDANSKYGTAEATTILKQKTLERCQEKYGWRCNLTSVDNLINNFYDQLQLFEAVSANDVEQPLVAYVDVWLDAFYESKLEIERAQAQEN